MLKDYEIGANAKIKNILEIGKELHLQEEELELFGKNKAKINRIPKKNHISNKYESNTLWRRKNNSCYRTS